MFLKLNDYQELLGDLEVEFNEELSVKLNQNLLTVLEFQKIFENDNLNELEKFIHAFELILGKAQFEQFNQLFLLIKPFDYCRQLMLDTVLY